MYLNCVPVDYNQAKDTYARRGVVTVPFDNCDNNLADSDEFTCKASTV